MSQPDSSHTATDCADEVYKRIAEATGEFLCVKKRDGTQALKCQRPCDCCWDLGGQREEAPQADPQKQPGRTKPQGGGHFDDLDDDIPF